MYWRRATRMCVVILETLGATPLLNDKLIVRHRAIDFLAQPRRLRQTPTQATSAFEALALHKAIDERREIQKVTIMAPGDHQHFGDQPANQQRNKSGEDRLLHSRLHLKRRSEIALLRCYT
jgi:hypothetical protein